MGSETEQQKKTKTRTETELVQQPATRTNTSHQEPPTTSWSNVTLVKRLIEAKSEFENIQDQERQIVANSTLKRPTTLAANLVIEEQLKKATELSSLQVANQTTEKQVEVSLQPGTVSDELGIQKEPLTRRSHYQKVLTNYGQWLYSEREKRGWTQRQLANMLDKPTTAIRRWEKNQAYPDIKSRQKLTRLVGVKEDQSLWIAEKGVTGFFKGLAKTFVSGIIGAALFPFFGPVVAAAAAVTTLMATSIQLQLEPLGLHLQEDTITKLAEPLHGKPFDESDLCKIIEDVLSKDRQAGK